MKCPLCQSLLAVVHTFDCEDNGRVQRLECTNEKCAAVVVAHLLRKIVAVNPGLGEGARALASRLRAEAEGATTSFPRP